MKIKQLRICKDSKLWIIVGIIILLVLNVPGLMKMKVPTILHDEMGYWADAAYFAGYDWSGITTAFSYYSYGIGLFLALFMKLTTDMILVYRIVMCLNVILLILMFFMAYKLSGIVASNVPRIVRVLAGVVALCYPTYLMNIGIAWSEYYNLFGIWLNIYLLALVVRKPKVWKMILLGISLGYLYMVHQRNIVVVCVGIIVIVYLCIKRKVSVKNGLVFLGVLCFIFVAHKYIKESILEAYWPATPKAESAVSSSENNYGGRLHMMLYAFKHAGIKTLFRSMTGKLYYLVIASCGIYVYSLIQGWRALKEVIIRKRITLKNTIIVYANFILLGLAMLSSIVSMEDGVKTSRIDSLVYGRYMEYALGPLLMLGVIELYQSKYLIKKYLYINLFILFISILTAYIYQTGMYGNFLDSCAGGIAKYFADSGEVNFVLEGGLIVIAVMTLIFVLKQRKKEYVIISSFAMIILIYVINGNYLNEKCRDKIQRQNQVVIPLAQSIDDIGESVPIYCIRDDLPYAYMYLEVLQYLLPDYEVSYIAKEDECLQQENYYLIVEDISGFNMTEYTRIMQVNIGWHVLVKSDSDLYRGINTYVE